MNALFQQPKPAFVAVRDYKFQIDQQQYPSLRVFIIKIQPIRKLFRNGKLQCYSMDGKISRNKTYCVFCDHAWKCQRKIRLSMLRLDALDPIILDVNEPSFENLQAFLDQCKDNLDTIPVTLKIIDRKDNKKSVEFTPDL